MTEHEDTALTATDRIAVLGAGTMGSGIALVAAAAGHTVLVHDTDREALARSMMRMRSDLDVLVTRGKITAAVRDARLARIVFAPDIAALAPARLVIEAVLEDMETKITLLGKMEAEVAPDAILATNTSSLSVTALAARLQRPQRFAGMHYFVPAPVMPLVEIVSGHMTERQTVATLAATARVWGKIPVHCRSTPGFIVNRVARPFYGEALRLLEEGAADIATLDAILRESGGFRMGAFELMDLIGNDVNYAITRTIYEALFNDPRYTPSLRQKNLVDAGLFGRKSGRGFYDYAASAARPVAVDAAPGPRPKAIVIEGALGIAAPLAEMARQAEMVVETREGLGVLRLDGAAFALTDGRSATQRMTDSGEALVLFDLALDYAGAARIAIAGPDQAGVKPIALTAGFFQALGKKVSVLDDVPGLVVMRTVAMLANVAAAVVQQGIASATDVDLAMLKGVNYPRGPLAWADAVTPALLATVMDNLASAYGEDRYRVAPLLRRCALTDHPFHSGNAET